MNATPDVTNRLVASYHANRADFMKLAKNYPITDTEKLRAYRRAHIAWHEAQVLRHLSQLDISDQAFLLQAGRFFLTHYNPEHLAVDEPKDVGRYPLYAYLPKPLLLNDRQQLMRDQVQDMGDRCQQLLIFSYYYQIEEEEIASMMELGSAVVVQDELQKCNYMVNRRLKASGLYPDTSFLSDADESFIDRALADELTQEERWDVEMRMENLSFRTAYDRRREWLQVIRVEGREHIHQLLQRTELAYAEQLDLPALEEDSKSFSLINVIIIFLVLMVGFFTYQWWNQEEKVNLFQQHFTPYPAPGPVTLTGDTLDNRLLRLFATYNRASWQLAYDQMQSEEPQYPILHFYLGVSALAMGDPESAQTWLLQVQPREAYYQAAQWYLALSHLATNDRQQARKQLKIITNAAVHPFRQQALDLVSQLE